MIDRLIFSAVLGTVGWNGLYPDPPEPLTASQLIKKGREQSVSTVCAKKRKTPTVKELCAKWEKHQ
jgi:hypothetical protein